jgi:hypothetical protein
MLIFSRSRKYNKQLNQLLKMTFDMMLIRFTIITILRFLTMKRNVDYSPVKRGINKNF